MLSAPKIYQCHVKTHFGAHQTADFQVKGAQTVPPQVQTHIYASDFRQLGSVSFSFSFFLSLSLFFFCGTGF
jgi:hypothetical protein